jgi:predicted transcriptional regulator
MGTGYFEYKFKVPANLSGENVTGAIFRCEVASRYPQGKYLEDSDAENIGMTIVTGKGTDPGYGQNSYPQTDEKKQPQI